MIKLESNFFDGAKCFCCAKDAFIKLRIIDEDQYAISSHLCLECARELAEKANNVLPEDDRKFRAENQEVESERGSTARER